MGFKERVIIMVTRITVTKEYKPIVDKLLLDHCTYSRIAGIMLKTYRVSIGLEGYDSKTKEWIKLN